VKSLVELQHGSLSLKSEPGKGSAFSFVITYKKAPPDTALQKSAEILRKIEQQYPDEQETKLRILIAEDNRINQSLIVHVLKRYGMVTEIAENGKVAVEKMKEHQYDLVLMDIQCPKWMAMKPLPSSGRS